MQNLGFILYRLIDFYELLILAVCILSWFPVGGVIADVYAVLRKITDPFVDIFRRLIPSVGGGGVSIDFSPMIAIVVLDLIKRVVLRF
ncbi:MAG: YggT family protein [Atopobiaceae bacterium]|nr:YggT family protein [Atopobiaceae bacterium]